MTCAHGMPSPASCVECMQDDGIPPPPREPVEILFMFPAKFDSTCRQCGDDINVGTLVAKLSNDRYVHASICSVEACR